MKDLKKQLMAAIAMTLVAAIAMGSSTYAWFANNSSVTAKGMTVNAIGDSSLVIKGSKDTSYASVGTNEVEETDLHPATSYDGVNIGCLSSKVVVKSSADEKATWTGTDGAFASADLVKVTSSGTYYLETTYSLRSLSEISNVYVKSITPGGTAANIDQALRASVTIGSTTYVYNVGGGTNSTEGVGKLTDSTWSLASKTYDAVNDNTKTWELQAYDDTDANTKEATTYTATVRVWYEGQDGNCFSDNISANDKTITIEFVRKTTS